MIDKNTAQETALACAKAMLEKDAATRHLGMEIKKIGPGISTLSMAISNSMLNFHNTCHGGYIFTLADSAFAFACNSHNKIAVAAAADISFIAPAFLNDELTATAHETHLAGRSGIYDVTITNAKNETIALFRGKSQVISQSGAADVT